MDDIITIVIYLIIMIIGAIASTKKKKSSKPLQKPSEKPLPKPFEEILREFGIPVEEQKPVIIEDNTQYQEKNEDNIFKTSKEKEQQKIYPTLESKYETLEKVENELESLETLYTNDSITTTIKNSDDAYKATVTYKIDENKITKTEIKSHQEEDLMVKNEIIDFMIKNPQSLIIYSDILKSKYF